MQLKTDTMKKQNRIIKINDNFSQVEIYFKEYVFPGTKNMLISVLVNSRTFTGNYELTVSKEHITSFENNKKKWLTEVQNGKLDKKFCFTSDYQNIIIEVEALSSTKIKWNLTFKPFLPDIEVLKLKIETELNLLNAFSWDK